MNSRDLQQRHSARSQLLAGPLSVLLVLLALSGCGSSDSAASAEAGPEQQETLSTYYEYLKENSEKLSHWVDTIGLQIKEGSVPRAESRYAAARVPYGHIAPAAQLFHSLNTKIDGLESDVPPAEYGGFHEIEKALYWEITTIGMKPVAKRLRVDVEKLSARIASTQIQPVEAIVGARKVVDGLIANELPGMAEFYSHGDLVDIAAKVEGVEAAFRAAKPALAEVDPEVPGEIGAQLQKILMEVGEYGTLARDPEQIRSQEPGISFIVYDQLTQKEKWKLTQPIKKLATLFSRAEVALANG